MKQFGEHLLMLIHMIKKLSIRDIELIIIQHVNEINEKRREIFVKNKFMICVITYHKNIEINNKNKTIHRYLFRKVDKLLMYYV